MDPGESNELLFPLARCASCGKEVLTYIDYDDAGAESFSCVHCDAPIAAEVRLANQDELSEGEYALVEEQGCGRPDCGRGRCGSS